MRTDILTHSGHYFSYTDLASNVVTIEDIAHGLSNVCRFAGHSPEFYSVAQHSVLVSYLVPAEDALAGLMHDATEAYLGDMPTPLKRLMPAYRELENRLHEDISRRFNLNPVLPPSVKQADLVALGGEKRDFFPRDSEPWFVLQGVAECPYTLEAWIPLRAKLNFLKRFEELTCKHS
ncbi:metal-dependent phosphohydrolase [Cupriavidus sp. RAF12]|uniref:metal-dependent phosphohydrolase n=1 Tax=Cupriavidus sp. RAF12 TaxID=3233050 RepID=UPI003F925016